MSCTYFDDDFVTSVSEALDRCDNFFLGEGPLKCRPFVVDGNVVGFVRHDCADLLSKYGDVFLVESQSNEWPIGCVMLQESLSTPEERTIAVGKVCQQMREREEFSPLKGWRDELYPIAASHSAKPAFSIERAAAGMIGMKQYGSHMNGYVWRSDEAGERKVHMWVARRAKTKATFPDMLDQIVAGGIGNGLGVRETIIKEAEEEACMPPELAEKAVAVGCISYFFEDPRRGLYPETEFLFDIELPETYVPQIVDGEVSEFFCWPLDEVCRRIGLKEFKPNCAVVIIDFLVRHGYITADNFRDYDDMVARLRQSISPAQMYKAILARREA